MGTLRVLQSFPVPRPTTNPYLVMLQDSLRGVPGVEVLNFSWRNALRADYDVFHVHWPEIMVDGRTPLRKAVRQVLTAAFLLRLRWRGTPVVRTMHNINLPEGLTLREKVLLRIIDRQTALRIILNPDTPVPAGAPHVLVPHGDYRQWFGRYPQDRPEPGRIACVGFIRRYKGVENLLAAFHATGELMEGLTLHVAGNPSTPELGGTMARLAGQDPRIHLHLEFIPDEQLVSLVTSAELVVLPYNFMHNSGAILAALSLGRPVLVPDNPVNRRLSGEVGPGWISTFEGKLTAGNLVHTLRSLRLAPPSAPPVFRAREWAHGAEAHAQAYRDAITVPRTAREVGKRERASA